MLSDIIIFNQNHQHLETGVYEFGTFGDYNYIGRPMDNVFKDEDGFEWSISGVCDNFQQVIDNYLYILGNDKKSYIIALYKVIQIEEPRRWGWRWKKFGAYIGNHKIEEEYLYDEDLSDIGQNYIYCFRILRVK